MDTNKKKWKRCQEAIFLQVSRAIVTWNHHEPITLDRIIFSKKMLTWKKVKNAKGYEVQVSTDKNFKKSKTKTYTVAVNKKKLTSIIKKGRKYYVRVRAYRSAMNGKVYSTYTKTLIIK